MRIILAFVVVVALAVVSVGAEITATNLYELQPTGPGTSNSIAVPATPIALPNSTFLVQYTNLVNTNALRVYSQFSLDGTNFITLRTYGPVNTNGRIDTFPTVGGSITGFVRAVIVTTNQSTVKVISIR